MTKKRIWFWIVGAIIIIASIFVCELTIDRYPNKWAQFRIVVSVLAFWLITITGYAYYLSHQSKGNFINIFCQTFFSNWSYFIIFVLIMFCTNCLWERLTSTIYTNNNPNSSILFFFNENIWSNIKQIVIWAPIWEEMTFRVLPFLASSLILFIVKNRKWHIALAILLGLMILGVQIYFGALHFNADYAEITGDTLMEHIIIQGVSGVIFATSYGVVLYNAAQILLKKNDNKIWIPELLYANLFAYLASFSVHSLYNLYCVFVTAF